MTVAIALALGLAIGIVLGALGGGGAILTVPALVYVLDQSAQEATTGSLVIVGITAIAGALGHARARHVRWRLGLGFGVAGIAAAFVGTLLNRRVDEHVLLLGFAAVMLLAAAGMLRRAHTATDPGKAGATEPAAPAVRLDGETTASTGATASPAATAQLTRSAPAATDVAPQRRLTVAAKIVAAGLVVGLLTGFFGVGGGFVIVPALLLALRLPMPVAIGTSLLVIAINSAASLAARASTAEFDWAVIAPFTAAAILGTFAGQRVADRLPSATLTRAFAVLLVAVAIYVAASSAAAL